MRQEETKMNKEKVTISRGVFNATLEYLSQQPYKEVVQLINVLHSEAQATIYKVKPNGEVEEMQ